MAAFHVETAAGDKTWIGSGRGLYNERLRLVDGKSPVLTASELATTLVVEDGKKRVPMRLLPGEVVTVRF